MIRKTLQTLFPLFLNIFFVLGMIFVVIGAAISLFSGEFWMFLLTLVLGSLWMVLCFGMIYIQIDMRDSLLDIQRTLKDKN